MPVNEKGLPQWEMALDLYVGAGTAFVVGPQAALARVSHGEFQRR